MFTLYMHLFYTSSPPKFARIGMLKFLLRNLMFFPDVAAAAPQNSTSILTCTGDKNSLFALRQSQGEKLRDRQIPPGHSQATAQSNRNTGHQAPNAAMAGWADATGCNANCRQLGDNASSDLPK